jgi:hypothetical protein
MFSHINIAYVLRADVSSYMESKSRCHGTKFHDHQHCRYLSDEAGMPLGVYDSVIDTQACDLKAG